MKTANDILQHHSDRLATRRVVCSPGLTADMPALLAEFLSAGRWLLVADENTWKAQGAALANALTRARQPFERLLVTPAPGSAEPVCEAALVAQVTGQLSRGTFSALVAVGSGTICDTVKLAAAEANLPAAAVATAPSMNGYPSVIAAVLRDGVKMTEPTRPPVLVLADLDTLAAAPARMIAAGMADLLAKPVSTADWTLAHELLGDAISVDGLAVVEQSSQLAQGIASQLAEGLASQLADGIASGLPFRETTAVARLFESLFVSGLAMAVSGASSPASGGEHLISHYLDMTALAKRGLSDFRARDTISTSPNGSSENLNVPFLRPAPAQKRGHPDSPGERSPGIVSLGGQENQKVPFFHDLHGLQVGVATLVTASFYRRLLDEWNPAAFDVAARVQAQRPWAEVESQLREHFGPTLAPAVLPQAKKLYAEGEALTARLARFVEIFPALRPNLAQRLAGADRIESELAACGAATRFSQIGVGRDRALAAVRHAHFVRARYTILHLLADLGVLDAWAAEAGSLFA